MVEPVRSVEFFLDPMCPYAYQGAVWIREVRARRPLDVAWRFFSLEAINRVEPKRWPWEREWSYGFGQMRVGAWLRRESTDLVDRWYAAVGAAFHERGERTHDPAVHRRILTEIGHPDALDAALADPTTIDEVRADHDEAVGTHAAWGVPLLVFPGGDALFGPVVAPAPRGAAAERLWDLVTGWREFPHCYELQRPKTPADLAHLAAEFRPYLEAREWRSIANPTP